MKLLVEWSTTYRYSEPVRLIHTELRALPTDRFGQKVLSAKLTVEPKARIGSLTDAFGNIVHHFDLLGVVDHISVELTAEVETAPGIAPAPQLTPLEDHLMRSATLRCPFDPQIDDFAAAGGAIAEPLAFGDRLVAEFGNRFQFEVGHTLVDDTAIDLLRLGHGVCQDFAHLMLAALRIRGIPARYVSGYLASNETRSAEADASHAWVQLWHDGAWHGFDPANNTRQDEHYIVTAVGRDYDDVAPVRGSYRGRAIEDWHAAVRVQSHEDTAP